VLVKKPEPIVVIMYNNVRRRGNDFSVGEAKIGGKQQKQYNSKYNFMQYVFFEKGIRSAQCSQLIIVRISK